MTPDYNFCRKCDRWSYKMVGDVTPDCKEMWNLTMVGNVTTPRITGCMKLSFVFVFVAFSTLQVRLEIQNYKFGEGFLIQLKRWWTDSHQGEVHENEEFGVNFQRIMTLMLLICVVFFFTSGVIYFNDYPLFGYVSQVNPSELIQIFVIDLLWMMIIIQHPVARNKLFHFNTRFLCKNFHSIRVAILISVH